MASRKVQPGAVPPPADLTLDEKHSLKAWALERWPWLTRVQLRDLVQECLDHHRLYGNLGLDWLAGCRKWITKAIRDGDIRPPSGGVVSTTAGGERREEARRQSNREHDRKVLEAHEKDPLHIAGVIAESRAKGWRQ